MARAKSGGHVKRSAGMMSPACFDHVAFFTAIDARRRAQQLSWPALAAAIWEQSRVLNTVVLELAPPLRGAQCRPYGSRCYLATGG
jgi:hypothetical protein